MPVLGSNIFMFGLYVSTAHYLLTIRSSPFHATASTSIMPLNQKLHFSKSKTQKRHKIFRNILQVKRGAQSPCTLTA